MLLISCCYFILYERKMHLQELQYIKGVTSVLRSEFWGFIVLYCEI